MFESDAYCICARPRIDPALPAGQAAAVLYRAILQGQDPKLVHVAMHMSDGTVLRYSAKEPLRDARIVCAGTEMTRDLVLAWISKSTAPKGKPIWSADRKEPLGRVAFEHSWPGVIPPFAPPPFDSTFLVFDTPMNALLGSPSNPYDAAIVALFLHQGACLAYTEHSDAVWAVPIFTPDLVFYTMPTLITYVLLDALMHPEVEMRPEHFSRSQKKLLQRSGAKVTMGAPAPYYEVRMVSRFTPPEPDRESRPVDWAHRWDVRGHERMLVRRGELPLDDKTRSKLQMRGYRIIEKAVPFEIARALAQRSKPPKRDDEWLAVKVSRVRSFQKGPADKPYVPSVHVEEWSDRMDGAGTDGN